MQSREGAALGIQQARPAVEDTTRGLGPTVPGLNLGTVDGQQDVDELFAQSVVMKGVP